MPEGPCNIVYWLLRLHVAGVAIGDDGLRIHYLGPVRGHLLVVALDFLHPRECYALHPEVTTCPNSNRPTLL